MFSTEDTIVAIATPEGRGGIGVIRLSGPDAQAIAGRLLPQSRPLVDRHATLVRIASPGLGEGEPSRVVDEAVVTLFRAPRSYTREDVVEISAHGSRPVLRRILELAIEAGARLAEPGEFTFRAVLNGRMDLVQAEAVADLVDAVTPLQARSACDQLLGTLTDSIREIERVLFDVVARLEASIDFPEEGFEFVSREEVDAALEHVGRLIAALGREASAGRLIREGAVVAVVGRANAGKSSLFNALVGAQRAIVTPIPGTTRDAVVERLDLEGLAVTLVDTAGLRETSDEIEVEGIRRAREAARAAAVQVLVIDGSVPLVDEDRRLATETGGATVIVASKSDLPAAWNPSESLPTRAIPVSVVTGEGLDIVRHAVVRALTSEDGWADPPVVTNVRHATLLREAARHIVRARETLAGGGTEEIVIVDVCAALDLLGAITGRRTADDVLKHIFATFCIGK